MSGWGHAWGDPWGGGVTVLANPFLARPKLRWMVRLHLANSFPIEWPYDFDQPPLRVSTDDTYPGGDIGPHLYERRILELPQVERSAPDAFGAAFVSAFTLRLNARDETSPYPDLHEWVAREHRGKYVDADAIDLETGEVALGIFRGEIVVMNDDLHTVSVLCRSTDPLTWTDIVPAIRVHSGTYPYAPPGVQPGLGSVTNLGIGVGRRIPCRAVRARHEDGTLTETVLTPDDASDSFGATEHDFLTGAGPYRLVTDGTLPTGFSSTADYYVIVVDEDTIRLASSPGNAATATAIELTDEGAGTLVLTGGLPPNLDDCWDFEVGSGNIGVLRVWEDDIPSGAIQGAVSDLPDSYEVMHERGVTLVRFRQPMDGVSITADIVRAYPDNDAGTVADWKLLRGFGDDIGGYDLISGVDAPSEATTADMVPNQIGIGLGGVRLDGTKYLQTQAADPFARQTFTVELEYTPTGDVTGYTPLWRSPRANTLTMGAQITYSPVTENFAAIVRFQGGGFFLASTPAGSQPKGQKYRVALRRNGAAGTTSFFVDNALVATATNANPILYGPNYDAMLLGFDGVTLQYARGIFGYCRYSNVARTDREIARGYYLMRRNGIEFLRDVAKQARKPVSEASFAAAAAAWDAIEGGALKCDGWLTEPNAIANVLLALVPFRDLRYDLDDDGKLTVELSSPPTEIKASFGVGDQYANLIAPPSRVRASLTEATQELAVHYRRARNGGAFGGYERQITRRVSLVGEPLRVLELPFVDDRVTADIVCDFQAKRRRTTETALDVAWGHEGRQLEPGDVIRVHLPAMGLDPIDLRLAHTSQAPARGSGRGVPVGYADYAYEPKLLAADPPEAIYTSLDLTHASVLATLVEGNVSVRLAFGRTTILRPTAGAATQQWPTLVGSATPWGAVDDTSPDDDSSYVQAHSLLGERFRFPALTNLLGSTAVITVTLALRLKNIGGASQLVRPSWKVLGVSAFDADLTVPTGAYANYESARKLAPAGEPWRLLDINDIEAGIYLIAPFGGSIRMTQCYLSVREDLPAPKGLGWVDYYVVGPSASAPAAPAETDTPLFSAADLGTQIDQIAGSSGQKFWYFARPRDQLGRSLGVVGPTSVTLP